MFENVLNPFAWWGMLALAVPIIIHLINRLRYRKVHWAAMEFLLKAMQKNKRKLLLEQLLLLLLRCLLIALVALLFIRPRWFLGSAGNESGSVHHHYILMDDSYSMSDLEDPSRPDGVSAFKRGTQLLADLAAAHSSSNALHHWTVLSWSNPAVPEFGSPLTSEKPEGVRMTPDALTRLRERFDEWKPTHLALTPLAVVQQANKYLETVTDGRRHIHIVSDFRLGTWRNSGDEVYSLLADLSRQGKVDVQLHDVAQPARSQVAGDVPPAHGNLGVTSILVKPRRVADSVMSPGDAPLRVVTPRLPFDVHVTVRNFGSAEHSRINLFLLSNQQQRAERILDRLAGAEERTLVFNMEYATDEPIGLKSLTVRLSDSENRDHLLVDNERYAQVELRSHVKVLLVDPEARSSQAASDWLYVNAALTGTSRTGVQADIITPRELSARRNLSAYSVVYLLNIAGVGRSEGDLDEDGLRNITRYVRQGGSLAWFLGPRTNVASFNDRLYQKGQGIFPVPLMLRPDPDGRKNFPFIDEEPDKDDFFAKVRFMKLHPAFPFTGEIAYTFARFIHINRYFRIDPQWKPGEGSEVLMQLVNRRPLLLYGDQVRQLAEELNAVASQVPAGKLTSHVGKILASIVEADRKKARKGELIEALSAALSEPAAADFWKDKKNADLLKKFNDLQMLLLQGDPVVVEAAVTGGIRTGRVMAFMIPAAPSSIQGKDYGWHDMAVGDLGQFFFVPMILGVQDHLSGQSRNVELTNSALVQAQPLELRLEQDRYHPQVELWYQGPEEKEPAKVDTITGERIKSLFQPTPGKESGASMAEQFDWLVKIKAVKGPGHYRLKFNQVGTASGMSDTAVRGEASINLDTAKIPEERPLSFNLDGQQEGEMSRLSEDQIRESLADGLQKGVSKLPAGEAREFAQSKNWFVVNALDTQALEALQSQTWSEYSWVLLLLLGLLMLEQYLAMKFSHHLA